MSTIDEQAIFAMLQGLVNGNGTYAYPEGSFEPTSYEDWHEQAVDQLQRAAEFYAENPLPADAQAEIRKMIDAAKAAGANDFQAAVIALIDTLPDQENNATTLLGLLGYFANES